MRHVLLAFLLLFSAPTVAFAQDEAPASEEAATPAEAAPSEEASAPAEAETPSPESVEDAVDAVSDEVSLLSEALQSQNWALVFGILLSFLVAIANKFGLKDKVGGKAIPWVTSGVAVAGAVGAALMTGVSVMDAVPQGLIAGVAAIGGWEMVLKHILARKSDPLPE
jgi:hypothetical protein